MTTKHYSSADGTYLGGFGDGAKPPAGAIERPAPPNGMAVWQDGQWGAPKLPFGEQQTAALDALAERRYQAEEGGMIFNGQPVPTDRLTQMKLSAAYVKSKNSQAYAVANWKFARGVFAPLGSAQIIAIADAMEAHVQACFNNEAALSALILAAQDAAALAAVDLEAGWP